MFVLFEKQEQKAVHKRKVVPRRVRKRIHPLPLQLVEIKKNEKAALRIRPNHLVRIRPEVNAHRNRMRFWIIYVIR